MKKYLILSVLIFLSCSRDLDEKFKQTVIEYQKKFPASMGKAKPAKIFTYQAVFYLKDKDTMFALTRKSSEFFADSINYEVYRDNESHFVIIDQDNFSKNFVFKKGKKVRPSLWWAGGSLDERCTPLYQYKVKSRNFHLVAIDTICEKWE